MKIGIIALTLLAGCAPVMPPAVVPSPAADLPASWGDDLLEVGMDKLSVRLALRGWDRVFDVQGSDVEIIAFTNGIETVAVTFESDRAARWSHSWTR